MIAWLETASLRGRATETVAHRAGNRYLRGGTERPMIQDEHSTAEPVHSEVMEERQVRAPSMTIPKEDEAATDAGWVIETVVCPFHCLYQDALSFHTQSRLARSESEASRLARAALLLYVSSAEASFIRRRSSWAVQSCGEYWSILIVLYHSMKPGACYRQSPPSLARTCPPLILRRPPGRSLPSCSHSEIRGRTLGPPPSAEPFIAQRVATAIMSRCKLTRYLKAFE